MVMALVHVGLLDQCACQETLQDVDAGRGMQKCAVIKSNITYVLYHNCICYERYCLSLGSCCHIAAHRESHNVNEVTACVKFFL